MLAFIFCLCTKRIIFYIFFHAFSISQISQESNLIKKKLILNQGETWTFCCKCTINCLLPLSPNAPRRSFFTLLLLRKLFIILSQYAFQIIFKLGRCYCLIELLNANAWDDEKKDVVILFHINLIKLNHTGLISERIERSKSVIF